MTIVHGFELIREQEIQELKAKAFLYRHVKTGAELMSLTCDDENKVFGITFRTPPKDSTGLPHILEHSVLCGSRKYPVKEPFVELLKGSLQTFLNAMTYPDKTCYPVASQNIQDFYNLVDVYLDAVFYPNITPYTLQQEGWHYELDNPEDPLTYKGVVFNEMKGAYSSPDNLLSEYSLESLFPDTPYSLDSGGDPKIIPDLTFAQFKNFHETYYHPSNSRIFFYGDDDPEKRLALTNDFLEDFERIDVDSSIPLQPAFDKTRRVIRPFVVSGNDTGEDDKALKGMVVLNWLLPDAVNGEIVYAFHILDYILLGMPGSPLRKALIESNLGEDLAGGGLGSEIRQMYFSIGLKGVDIENSDRIVNLITQTLANLVKNGIDSDTIEAAINTLEFSLRENNTGSFPRGLALMLNSLNTWLYDEDPLKLVAFEKPLGKVKSGFEKNKRYFEEMLDQYFLQNKHRTTLILKPDPEMAGKEKAAEESKLAGIKESLSQKELEDISANAAKLKELQGKPDSPDDLASIPMLSLSDMEKFNKKIPVREESNILYHDLFTNGIAYLDIGFNLHLLPQKYLPYVRLFGRSLLEMGTETEDYVTLSQRISRKTGGIWPSYFISLVKDKITSTAWMFLRGKTMSSQTEEMLDIMKDVFLTVRLDNKERFKQMALEAKAREEQKLVPSGHQIVNLRLRAHFNEADWAAEQMNGISYLFFLRELIAKIETDWQSVLDDLEAMRKILINGNDMVVNVTQDEAGWKTFQPEVLDFMGAIPSSDSILSDWNPDKLPEFEGLTIPSQVNYVGKGANLYKAGHSYFGSIGVITRFIRNSWLWEQVRVKGGAYGSFCMFDRFSGTLTFVSYRDPNLIKTIDAFDETARFLRELDLNNDELVKGIIGTIGDIDAYKLPDAKGYSSMVHKLINDTDDERQKIREEILGAKPEDFKVFAEMLETVKNDGMVKVLGSQGAIDESMAGRPDWLKVLKVL